MHDIDQLFWNASVEEIKNGFVYDGNSEEYICLICGKSFKEGVIYQADGILYDAKKAVKTHISSEHSSVFEYLLNLDKKFTGITDVQKNLLSYFYNGCSNNEIAAKMNGVSTSTIRNHRFVLKQKEKQSKIFLCLMELLKESKDNMKQDFIDVPRSATMIDERFAITKEENDKILKKYFDKGLDGPLSDFPIRKEKRKVVILRHLSKRFDPQKKYTEKEVNEILKAAYDDYVTLRRYLIDYGFMDRLRDGSQYWLK